MSAVSVIVPVFNVEQYIEKCARSLFEQTLEDVEYIFVNDCTPDYSITLLKAVIDQYPQCAHRVTIVNKPHNEGLPAARRTGLVYATGKYIAHCDSDDWVEPDFLERMYDRAEAYGADAVICGLFKDNDPVPTRFDVIGENSRDLVFGNLLAAREMASVWRFMARREIYSKDIVFPSCNQGEDIALLVQLAYYCESIVCEPHHLYHWRINMASITREPSPEAVIRRFEGSNANVRLIEDFLREKEEDVNYAPQLSALKLYSKFYLRPLLRKGEGIDEWRAQFPEIKGNILFNKHIKFANKVEYLLVRYCPASMIKILYRWRSSSRS